MRTDRLFRTHEPLAFGSSSLASVGEDAALLVAGGRNVRADATATVLAATGRRPIQFVALWFLAWATLR